MRTNKQAYLGGVEGGDGETMSLCLTVDDEYTAAGPENGRRGGRQARSRVALGSSI